MQNNLNNSFTYLKNSLDNSPINQRNEEPMDPNENSELNTTFSERSVINDSVFKEKNLFKENKVSNKDLEINDYYSTTINYYLNKYHNDFKDYKSSKNYIEKKKLVIKKPTKLNNGFYITNIRLTLYNKIYLNPYLILAIYKDQFNFYHFFIFPIKCIIPNGNTENKKSDDNVNKSFLNSDETHDQVSF